ncbi:hypothetical protein AVEN_143920-1 [Araneus ventricosus]|uniref:Uncharacterized protein n=1 Tax=Araneus ventricosus TaxID=182803 RepID=A0A4Y2S811_ARAVE|nr:hypothetical protein AVEN_143920-1 [Araneus ventricosus]
MEPTPKVNMRSRNLPFWDFQLSFCFSEMRLHRSRKKILRKEAIYSFSRRGRGIKIARGVNKYRGKRVQSHRTMCLNKVEKSENNPQILIKLEGFSA